MLESLETTHWFGFGGRFDFKRDATALYRCINKYVDGGVVVNYEFDANVDVYQLEDNLKRFLKACSWLPETLDKIFVDNDE